MKAPQTTNAPEIARTQSPWLIRNADYIRALKIQPPMGKETVDHNDRLEAIAKLLEKTNV